MFPLKLKSFERLFLFADRIENPSTFIFELKFTGSLQRELANSAVEYAVQTHPLSRCQIQLDGSNAFWVPANAVPQIVWCDQSVDRRNVVDLDLVITDGPPLRLLAHDGDSGAASMVILFHHCAFDGLGAIQWVEEFLSAYRKLDSGEPLSPGKLDSNFLRNRCQPNQSWLRSLRLLPGQWRSVRETYRVITREVVPLVVPVDQVEPGRRHPGYLTFQLSAEETSALKSIAAKRRTSLNSMMARDLMVAIKKWHAEQKIEPTGSHFRLMIPVDERGRLMRKMPACNHCTIINLDFPPQDVSAGEVVVSEIDRRMKLIRDWKLSFNFWRAIRFFDWLPGGLKRYSERDGTNATALFTNIGRVFQKFAAPRCPESDSSKSAPVSLADMQAYAPLARGVYGAFTVYNFRNELRVSMHYDARLTSAKEAGGLMSMLKGQFLANLNRRLQD